MSRDVARVMPLDSPPKEPSWSWMKMKDGFLSKCPWIWEWGHGLGFSHFSLGFLLLLTVILLPNIHCVLGSKYSSYEIVIPRRLMTWEGEERISYSIFMKGKKLVIHLKQKKGLLANNFPIYTYYNGNLSLDMPFLRNDCYYDGYVESYLRSLVSISTCSGLKGLINIEGTVYRIEPIDASSNFEHILYQTKSDEQDFCSGPLREQPEFESNLEAKGMAVPSGYTLVKSVHYEWPYMKEVKIFVVVDNNRYRKWDSNVTKAAEMVMEAISIMDTYVFPIRVKITWVGLEVWTERDIISISRTLPQTLSFFSSWKYNDLFLRIFHNIAYLIVGHETGSQAGYTYTGGVCSIMRGVSALSFSHENVPRFASLMTHELGHSLAIEHDTEYCMCGDEYYCIMHESVSQQQLFSNCSFEHFYTFMFSIRSSCLARMPGDTTIFRIPVCGNGILERGEECDCGTNQNCAKDPCCLPTCRFTVGSTCAFGPCCKNCNIQKANEVCRPSKHECDFPEYCNGTSIWCQPDVYKQDGTKCKDGYCFEGHCQNLDKQCVEVFGKGSKKAPDNFYKSMNSKGDRIGNCGPTSIGMRRTFRKCEPKDSKCGKLLCQNIQKLPRGKNHYTYFQLPFKGSWYWGAELLEEIGNKDRGEVHSGTVCGPRKICLNNVCSDIHQLRQRCNSAINCTGRGMCNNLDHCHCDDGYSPPHCINRDSQQQIHSQQLGFRLSRRSNNSSSSIRWPQEAAVEAGDRHWGWQKAGSNLLQDSPMYVQKKSGLIYTS
ncbi:disintegrin and metalloproteinase domain-containing protein 1a-like [Gracilinanus agilis]|uniref:disintegrin and metalloproteinase domain-containing protein 1a-like n=1 Tax=Gracilinanus agilis TaxID=191870 RepID=UPI001CFEC1B4|nr:disintegrin and metalloproteinase domain-containing protein 1a-like [Gracilinanus agilis]